MKIMSILRYLMNAQHCTVKVTLRYADALCTTNVRYCCHLTIENNLKLHLFDSFDDNKRINSFWF